MLNVNYSILQMQTVDKEDERFDYLANRLFRDIDENCNTINLEKDNYKEVYKGSVGCCLSNSESFMYVLEYLFIKFNTSTPNNFVGRSLSVSDIVRIEDKYFRCQNFGFNEIIVV